MIINHEYKFIFVKTLKTAGTSIEIALSRFCGENDILTPISVEDELTRQKMGGRGKQNYYIPPEKFSREYWKQLIKRTKGNHFYNHTGAQFIRDSIDEEIWKNYFKFCFERNPFDKAISLYYYKTREPRPNLSEYLATAPIRQLSNWDNYTINGHIAVDFVGRYEKFDEDLKEITRKLGLPEQLQLPRAKGNFRTDRKHYSQVLNEKDRERIEVVCAREIAALGYHWEEIKEK